jgi:hypothetical protein
MAQHSTVRSNSLDYDQLYINVCLVSRTQRYSSYVFSIFGLMHITNTAIIPLVTQSVATSDTYLLLTRPYYQSRLLEPLLVGAPIAIHVISGIALRIYRRRQAAIRYGAQSHAERRAIRWPPVSAISALGFALAPLAVMHRYIVRGLPLWYEGSSANSGLGYVAHGFARLPLLSFVGYTALVSVAAFHFTWGWAKWLSLTPAQTLQSDEEIELTKKRRWYSISGVAGCLALVWLGGGLGVVGRGGAAEGWVAGVYDGLLRRIPLVGKWV